jgi:hypothetical protein
MKELQKTTVKNWRKIDFTLTTCYTFSTSKNASYLGIIFILLKHKHPTLRIEKWGILFYIL